MISQIRSTALYVEINQGGRVDRVNHSDLRVGSDKLRADDLKERLQILVDFRQPLSELPDDDPDKTTDPALPFLFWDQGDLVGRSCLIKAVSWDGQRFTVSIERVR